MTRIILVFGLLTGCTDRTNGIDHCTTEDCGDPPPPPPPLPTCASLGCPFQPSGRPDVWVECTTATCWCRGFDDTTRECRP